MNRNSVTKKDLKHWTRNKEGKRSISILPILKQNEQENFKATAILIFLNVLVLVLFQILQKYLSFWVVITLTKWLWLYSYPRWDCKCFSINKNSVNEKDLKNWTRKKEGNRDNSILPILKQNEQENFKATALLNFLNVSVLVLFQNSTKVPKYHWCSKFIDHNEYCNYFELQILKENKEKKNIFKQLRYSTF